MRTPAHATDGGSTLLVVDDEPGLRRSLRATFDARGYTTVLAATGAEALAQAASAHPDLVLLDLGLPDLDGIEVVHGLRGWTSVPIMVLSARDAQADKVAALDAGADDFVTKPFGMDELLARVRAALRRHQPTARDAVVRTPHFEVDLARKQVRRGDEAIRLTPTEWQVLEILVRNEGRLVTQLQLLRDVWGPSYRTETSYLRLYLAQLRRKLEPTPSQPCHLLTEPGIGYRFERGAASDSGTGSSPPDP